MFLLIFYQIIVTKTIAEKLTEIAFKHAIVVKSLIRSWTTKIKNK